MDNQITPEAKEKINKYDYIKINSHSHITLEALITLLLIYFNGFLTGFLIQSCTLHPINFTYCSKLYFPKLQHWLWVCLAQKPWRLSISFRITSVFLSVLFICFCELITTYWCNFISEPLHTTCTKVTLTLHRWPDLLRILIILLTTTTI